MTDRVLIPGDLTSPGPRPGLYQLRVLERRLRERVRELDLRVIALTREACRAPGNVKGGG